MILVKGTCGLGNRMLALIRAAELAKKHNTKLEVCWRDDYYTDGVVEAFGRYFELTDEYKADSPKEWNPTVYPEFWEGRLTTPYDKVGNFKGNHKATGEKITGFAAGYDISVIAPSVVNYKSNNDIKRVREKLPKIVKLNSAGQKLQTEALEAVPEYTTGIHIRWAAPTKRKINLDDLFDKIDEALETTDSILITSDNSEPIEKIKERYGDIAKSMEKWTPTGQVTRGTEKQALHRPDSRQDQRSQDEVYRDAVKEMLMLASCDKIIYQHNSSFGVLAAGFSAQETTVTPWGVGTRNVNENY